MNPSRRAALTPVSGNTAETRPSNNAYFPALDGVRGVAFLAVFAFHFSDTPWGWAGIDAFFVLSGFLITGILFDTRDAPHRVRNFYVRRTLRIFPLYYGLLLLFLLSDPIFRWEWDWSFLAWPAYVGNLLGVVAAAAVHAPAGALIGRSMQTVFPQFGLSIGHFWTLCVEEQFYLLWPCAVFWIKDRRKLLALCAGSLVVCPLLRLAGERYLPAYLAQTGFIYIATPFRIDALMLGGLLALVRRGPAARRMMPVARVGFVVLAATGLLWVGLNRAGGHAIYLHPVWNYTWGLSYIDAFSACVIVMCLEFGSVAFRLFNLRPLRWLGRISYGAYVLHDLPHPLFQRLSRHYTVHWELATGVLSFGFTLVAAWASFRWFETPFIRMKDRLTR